MSSHAASGAIDHHHDHTTSTGIPNKKLLMWTFLASDCMFFGALIVGVFEMGLRLVGTDPQWTFFLIGVLIIFAVAVDQWIRKAAA